jgi:hypothetical protein
MAGVCEGRVVAITDADLSLGRAYVLGQARRGAKPVVNNLGAARDCDSSATGLTQEMRYAERIGASSRRLGGSARLSL